MNMEGHRAGVSAQWEFIVTLILLVLALVSYDYLAIHIEWWIVLAFVLAALSTIVTDIIGYFILEAILEQEAIVGLKSGNNYTLIPRGGFREKLHKILFIATLTIFIFMCISLFINVVPNLKILLMRYFKKEEILYLIELIISIILVFISYFGIYFSTATKIIVRVFPERMEIPDIEELLRTQLIIELGNRSKKKSLKGKLLIRFPKDVKGKVYMAYPVKEQEFHNKFHDEFEIPPRKVRWYEFFPLYVGTRKTATGFIELKITIGKFQYKKTIYVIMYKS